MILDNKGRFLGRINLLDLMILFFLLSLGRTVWYAVRVSHRQTLEVFSVEPKRIVAGSGKRAVMKGTGFDSMTTVRLGDYNDQGGVLIDESTIGLDITEQYDPGLYRIIVHDGRGRYAALPDALEVIWMPQISEVKPRIIYNSGIGARIEIFGKLFTDPCTVRIGNRELMVTANAAHQRIEAQLKAESPPLPLGEQALTVTNAGGQSVTLERGVTVLDPPEFHSIEPQTFALGQIVDLFIHGTNLQQGTRIWFGDQCLGEARYVSPELLRILVTGTSEISGEGLALELPGGPKMLVLEKAVWVRSTVPVLMVVDILLDEKGLAALEWLPQLPAWKKQRPIRNLDLHKAIHRYSSRTLPVVEVVLPAAFVASEEKYQYRYRDLPLYVGSPIVVNVDGRRLSGTVAAEPFTVVSDDLLKGGIKD